MKFDNLDNLMRLRAIMYIMAFIIITISTIANMTDYLYDYFIPVSGKWYLIVLVSVFVIYMLYRNNLRYHYVSFSDDGPKIILRYYRMGVMSPKYRSIEIPKENFWDFEIQSYFFNKRKEIIVSQKGTKGIAKYPSVSLTGLTKEQYSGMIETLKLYVKKAE